MSNMGPRPANPGYQDAIAYLNSCQTPFATLDQRRKAPPRDLTKSEALVEMRQWVQDIGYQPSDFEQLNIVHVAGTKGKGTTCAFVNSILLQFQEKYNTPEKVGLYTSPHLLSVCERIRINSRPISEELFTKYFFEVWDRLEGAAEARGTDKKVKPVYFRFLTLLSFHVFVRERVDVAIYEVGVGGEFDSTNVVTRPAVTGITSLGIDHTQVLGNTIEEIAWHKAGIFKTGSPAYTVWQPELAMDVLKQRAQARDVVLTEVPVAPNLQRVGIVPNELFQKRNASLAVVLAARALVHLNAKQSNERPTPPGGNGSGGFMTGLHQSSNPIDLASPLPDLFSAGLTTTVWRGRAETVSRDYGRWHLDGAHTVESLEIVSDWFGKSVHEATQGRPNQATCILVFNQQTGTRDAKQLIEAVQRRLSKDWNIEPAHAIFCTNVTYKSQGYKIDFVDGNSDPTVVKSLTMQHDYATSWHQSGSQSTTHVLSSIEEAVATVRELSQASPAQPTYILATGSFRLIGGVLTILEGEIIATEPSTKMN